MERWLPIVLLVAGAVFLPHRMAGQNIALSRTVFDFGVVSACDVASDTFAVINNSDRILPWLSGSDITLGSSVAYRVSFEERPGNMSPGMRQVGTITFVGDASRPNWNMPYEFSFRLPDTTVRLPFVVRAGRSAGPCVLLSADTIVGAAGMPADIVVRQTSIGPAGALHGVEVDVVLTYDASVLVPDPRHPTLVASANGRVTARVVLDTVDDIVLRLPATVVLGQAAVTPLGLTVARSTIPVSSIETKDAAVILIGTCPEPRYRGFDPVGAIPARLLVVDVLGRVLGAVPGVDVDAWPEHLRSIRPVFLIDVQRGRSVEPRYGRRP